MNFMSDQERRKYPRHENALLLKISTRSSDGDERNLQCPCRDVSGGGLSFLCDRPVQLEIGQRIQVSMSTDDADTPLNLGKGTVVWVQDDDDGPAWAGVMLDELLDEKHMEHLLVHTI